MPEILSGPVGVDDLVVYKGGGISPELITKAAPKLGTKRLPRRFFSNIRSLHILVSTTPDRIGTDGRAVSGEAVIVKFKDGRFTTRNADHIAAIEDSYTYGLDTFDVDEMEKAVEERNTLYLLDLVDKSPAVASLLRERAVADFLELQQKETAAMGPAAKGPDDEDEDDGELEEEDLPAVNKPPKKGKRK